MTDAKRKESRKPSDVKIELKLEVRARLEEIDKAVLGLMDYLHGKECIAGSEFEVELATREALANAIVHGCKKNPRERVFLSAGCDPNLGVLIVIQDSGSGFDPKRLPNPLMGSNLYAPHGRGIYLINQAMDEVKFSNGGRKVEMRKKPSQKDRAKKQSQ